MWMSRHLPPCFSAEMSSEHIRTLQVAQKLPRRQSPPTPEAPAGPGAQVFWRVRAGLAGLPEGRAGSGSLSARVGPRAPDPTPAGAARRASPPAGPSAPPRPAGLSEGRGRQAQGRLPPRSAAADPVAPVEPRPRPRLRFGSSLCLAWPAGPRASAACCVRC